MKRGLPPRILEVKAGRTEFLGFGFWGRGVARRFCCVEVAHGPQEGKGYHWATESVLLLSFVRTRLFPAALLHWSRGSTKQFLQNPKLETLNPKPPSQQTIFAQKPSSQSSPEPEARPLFILLGICKPKAPLPPLLLLGICAP